jgi:N6-adenosine-specific RNA methylase IME4
VSDLAHIEEKIKRSAAAQKAGSSTISYGSDSKAHSHVAEKATRLKSIEATTYEGAAKRAGISPKAVRQFRSIEKKAPEVASMVRGGLKPVDGMKLAALPAGVRAAAVTAVSGGAEVRAAVRAAKKDDYNRAVILAAPKALEGTYRILYADPPWKYVGLNQADEYGHAERHYDCLDDEQLKKYKVSDRLIRDVMDKNAALFLWVTSPLLARCFAVIEAWGFDYKSSFVWDKVKHNMGHYNSVRHELLLICVRGSCKPDVQKLVDSVQSIERSSKHSEKPEEFRKIIESLYDHGRKLELFRRGSAPDGWDTEGNEAS